MATGIAITDITANPAPALTAVVTLTGLNSGAVTFKASRTPYIADAVSLSVSGSFPSYTITLPYSALWFVWATDSGGTTDPFALATDDRAITDLPAVGEAVASLLRDYQIGIEARLRQYFEDSTLKYIQYGYGGEIERYPSIIVGKPKVTPERVGIPQTWEYTFEVNIFLLGAMQNDETNVLAYISQFTAAVISILNMTPNEHITTAKGIPLYNCMAREGESEIMIMEQNRFGAIGTVIWTGQAMLVEGS